MTTEKRQRKVEQTAQKIAGNYFAEHNPPGQLVTVTRVDASSDLSYLTVFINLLPEDDPEEDIVNLREKLSALRKLIGDKMDLRRVPELRVEFDKRETSRQRVEEILNDSQ